MRSHHFMANRWGNNGNNDRLYFWGAPKSLQMVTAAMKLKDGYSLEETQAGIKIAGRNINNLRYADDTTLMAESEEELKSLLIKVKEESEKAGLKFNIQILRSWHLVPSLHGK